MAKIAREEMKRRRAAFAAAWATPGTETYRNATRSYIAAVEPECTLDAAHLGGSRYLHDPAVQAEIARIQEAAAVVNGLTSETFILECLEREERMLALAEAGNKSAAMAAVNYRKLAGQAAGLFVNMTRDLTPPAPGLPLPKSPDELRKMQQALALMAEIATPLPLPTTTADPVPEAPDYESPAPEESDGEDAR